MKKKHLIYITSLFALVVLVGAGCNEPKETITKPEAQPSPTMAVPAPNTPPNQMVEEMIVQDETKNPKEHAGDEVEIRPETKEFSMTAKQWEFTPSTITVNQGDKVRLSIKSIDVDHGFAITAFGMNENLKAGETTVVEFVADKSGTYSFFCSVFCGSGHSNMTGTLIVQ